MFKTLFIFRERGREGEREGEKHSCVVASNMPCTGDTAHNPGLCPDWELNWRPFSSQASTQSTEPHQQRLEHCFNSRDRTGLKLGGVDSQGFTWVKSYLSPTFAPPCICLLKYEITKTTTPMVLETAFPFLDLSCLVYKLRCSNQAISDVPST